MPQFVSEPVRVRVPATSANLGPGFDCAGLCLSLYDDVVVRVADAGLAVDIAGEGEDTLPRNRRHLVVASLHAAFDRSPTERVLAAIDNPHVDCIGHLTARKINRRGPADVDVARVIEHAVSAGCFLEINSQPDRLDLRDAHARAAGEAGLRIAVSSDAHSAAALRYVELGIGQARRGWLERDQVLNTRPWPEIARLLRR